MQELEAGVSFGDYDVVDVRGRGAMTTTYRATRRRDGRKVALKIPHPEKLSDADFVLRFLQEAHLSTRLDSPFVVQVYDAGQANGVPYMAMEFLEGMTLKEALAASKKLAPKRALEICHGVAIALEHAHGVGVIHRDLKPDNVMLRVGVGLKVMDFGIAKVLGEVGITSSNLFLGSPAYAAPEAVSARDVDHRADLYSLGIMLYEMLQGRPPFVSNSPVEVLLMHRAEPMPAYESLTNPVPQDVWRLVEALTAKNPDDRLPDARSLRLAIELLLRE